MVSEAIPEILYKQWFWLPIAVVLTVIIHFIKRKGHPPFPRVGRFFARHKRLGTRISDIFVICIVLLWWPFFLLDAVMDVFRSLSAPESSRTMLLQSNLIFLFTLLIIWSGTSGFFVGLLSVFQSNLTKTKSIILLIVCLLPVAFTVLQILTEITENPWLTVQLCLYCSALSWIINVPSIIIGKHLIQVFPTILRKLRLISGNYST